MSRVRRICRGCFLSLLGSLSLLTLLAPGLAATASAAELPEGWTREWSAAVKAAKQKKKPLLAVFSASWCRPCQAMVRDIYPQPAVRKELQNWVPVYIDIDKQKSLAQKYRVRSVPTMVYLGPDLKELNRTIGGVAAPEKMVELLKAKGGARFEGGSRSPLLDRQLTVLATKIQAEPNNSALRKQRIQTILEAVLDSGGVTKLDVARDDIRELAQIDVEAFNDAGDLVQLYSTLLRIKQSPKDAGAYARGYLRQYAGTSYAAGLRAFMARRTMKAANYQAARDYMKDYLETAPKGPFVDEFKLLLPQIEGFLKLTKGVKFD